ncbi:MAG: hypothetical protein ACKVQU_31235 [Burkholderiales bacterium]
MAIEYSSQITYIEARGTEILHRRTSEDLRKILATVCLLLPQRLVATLRYLSDKPIGEPVSAWESPADNLLWCIGRFEIAQEGLSPNVEWAECFAALALDLVEAAKEPGAQSATIQVWRRSLGTSRKILAVDLVFAAIEAITIADLLDLGYLEPSARFAEIKREVRAGTIEHKRLETRRAALKRHEPMNRVKDAIVQQYLALREESPRISNRQAAKRILKALPDEQRKLLRSDEPEKTIENWIGAFKRSESGEDNDKS